jgi:hypothetical protein
MGFGRVDINIAELERDILNRNCVGISEVLFMCVFQVQLKIWVA